MQAGCEPACKSVWIVLRFARTRVWSAQQAAGAWALEHSEDADTIVAAIRERAGGPAVGSQQATAFVAAIEREIEPGESNAKRLRSRRSLGSA